MKITELSIRLAACVALALFSPWSLAQTCVAGVQASNPMSAYVIDSANGTVTDTRTGLMWDRCVRGWSGAACATGASSSFNWQSALNDAATIGSYKGFSDWRMPNVKELRSLVEECRTGSSINEFAFPNTPAGVSFWSGSPFVGNATGAWLVNFSDGNASIGDRGNANQVRLVRAGQ